MDQEKPGFSNGNQEIIAPIVTGNPNSAALKDAGFDESSLWNRVSGDRELLRDLVEMFAKQGPELISEMKQALEENSAERLRRVSHKMKGSALQFSAPDAAALAASLENMGKQETLQGAGEVLLKLENNFQALIRELTLMVNGRPQSQRGQP